MAAAARRCSPPEMPGKTIFTVESDRRWTRDDASLFRRGGHRLAGASAPRAAIGKTGKWGRPVDNAGLSGATTAYPLARSGTVTEIQARAGLCADRRSLSRGVFLRGHAALHQTTPSSCSTITRTGFVITPSNGLPTPVGIRGRMAKFQLGEARPPARGADADRGGVFQRVLSRVHVAFCGQKRYAEGRRNPGGLSSAPRSSRGGACSSPRAGGAAPRSVSRSS